MTADILAFPAPPAPVPPARITPCGPGDMVLTCINARIGLWCAWPVALVDDDGVVLAVSTRDGRKIGVDRLNCDPSVFALRESDHEPQAFAGMRWRTWQDVGAALIEFAEIGVRR